LKWDIKTNRRDVVPIQIEYITIHSQMPMQDMKKVLSASHRYAILYGSKHSVYKKDPWMSYSKPVALADIW
jgi:hypothetical protein